MLQPEVRLNAYCRSLFLPSSCSTVLGQEALLVYSWRSSHCRVQSRQELITAGSSAACTLNNSASWSYVWGHRAWEKLPAMIQIRPVRFTWSQHVFCTLFKLIYQKKNLFSLWLEDVDIGAYHKHSVFYMDANVISVVWTLFGTMRSNTVSEILQAGYGEDMVWTYSSKSLDCKWHWLKRQNRKYFQGLVFISIILKKNPLRKIQVF